MDSQQHQTLVEKFNQHSKSEGQITKKCSDLKPGRRYSVHSFVKKDTRYGDAVIAVLGDFPFKEDDEPKLQVFLPKRFLDVLLNSDLEAIEPGQYYLVSHGAAGSKSTELTLHQMHSIDV